MGCSLTLSELFLRERAQRTAPNATATAGYQLIPVSFGFNAGYAINPARDFSPRLFTLIAGWGAETFSYGDTYWFYVPILGPFVGGAIGAACYTLLVDKQVCVRIFGTDQFWTFSD